MRVAFSAIISHYERNIFASMNRVKGEVKENNERQVTLGTCKNHPFPHVTALRWISFCVASLDAECSCICSCCCFPLFAVISDLFFNMLYLFPFLLSALQLTL